MREVLQSFQRDARVRSVEESNGAEAWRLIHCRYAPDTQNRQYALMQKIMIPAKLWYDHAKGFQSGLRAWELDVGEWERASGTALADAVKCTVMMNMAPIFLRNILQLGTYENSTALRTALLQSCCSSRNFGANPTVSAGNGTSAYDDWMQVDSLKKGKGKGKGRTTSTTNTSSTDINTCKNCGMDIGRKTAGDQVEERMTIPPVTTATRSTARVTGKAKGKANTWTLWERISLLKQPQPCRILHKHRVQWENSRGFKDAPGGPSLTAHAFLNTQEMSTANATCKKRSRQPELTEPTCTTTWPVSPRGVKMTKVVIVRSPT